MLPTRLCAQSAALVAVALLAASAVSQAQMRVTPVIKELSLRPGAAETFEIRVASESEAPLSCYVSWSGMELEPNGRPVATAAGDPRSCAPWISVDQVDFALSPGEVRRLVCTARPPRGTTGGYYALLRVSSRPASRALQTQGPRVVLGFAMDIALLAVVVTPHMTASVEPEPPELALNPPGARTGWEVRQSVTNPGDVHARVEGRVEILDLDARKVAGAQLNVGRGYVLPGGRREFRADGSERLRDGIYTVRVKLGPRGEEPKLTAVSVLRVKDGVVDANVPPEAVAAARGARGEFAVENPELYIQLAPGSRRGSVIRLRNQTREPQWLEPHVLRWWVSPTGEATFSEAATPRDATPWLDVTPSRLYVPAGARASLKVGAAVPRGTAAGEYFAAILLVPEGEAVPKDPSVLAEQGTVVSVNVGKPETPDVTVENIRVLPGREGGLLIEFEVHNRGGARIWPTARVVISDSAGNRLEPEIAVVADDMPVMPGSYRIRSEPWVRLLRPAPYQVSVYLQYEGAPSPLTARASFVVPLHPTPTESR